MTKISKILEAGHHLERNKTGFTIMELMSTLSWSDNEKQYVQNIMFQLTKKGKAHKLNNGRPVIYTLKSNASAEIKKPQILKSINEQDKEQTAIITKATADAPTEKPGRQLESSSAPSVISPEDLSDMEVPLELIGEGVFRRNRQLERKIYELESELVETKRKLDDANKRIGEQTRMIEKQNQIISDQNRDRRPKFPTAKLKEAASIDWKRRSR
jgi:hypothetical protein